MNGNVIAIAVVLVVLSGLMRDSHAFGQAGSKSVNDTASTPGFSYNVIQSFKMSANTTVSKTKEVYNLQIGGDFRADASMNIGRLNLSPSFEINLAQKVQSDAVPERTRDDLKASFIPSMLLYEKTQLRLFLELTLVTQLTKTIVDENYLKSLMDPAFYYQTLYLGQLFESKAADKSSFLSFKHGIGYALQQTVYSRFVLTSDRLRQEISPTNPLRDVQRKGGLKLEAGVSYVADFSYWADLNPGLTFRFNLVSVLLSKNGFIGDPADSRAVCSLKPSIKYKQFFAEYEFLVTYDKNYSKRRKLIQELSVGISFDLHR